MARSFIIDNTVDEPIKTAQAVVGYNALAPTFDDLMSTLTVDGIELLGIIDGLPVYATAYEQLLNRSKPMNIKGSQEPYLLTTAKED